MQRSCTHTHTLSLSLSLSLSHTHLHTGIAPAPATIARDLEMQAADQNSPLRLGKLTSYTKGIQVFYNGSEPLDPLQARVLGGVVTEGTGGVERIGRGAVRDLTQQLQLKWVWVWVWVCGLVFVYVRMYACMYSLKCACCVYYTVCL